MTQTAPAGSGPHPRENRGTTSEGGLTAAAATVFVVVVTVVAGVLSAATGRGFGIAFNLVYLVTTIYIALRIYVNDRFLAVIVPPLAYAFALLVGGHFDTQETNHAFRRVLENTIANLAFGAPWLVGATIAAIVIAVVRGRRAAVGRSRNG